MDRSIASPSEFIETNIVGTFRLLQTVLKFWRALDEATQKRFRFHYVSLRIHILEERSTLPQDRKSQPDKFKEAASELEADEDEQRWEEKQTSAFS